MLIKIMNLVTICNEISLMHNILLKENRRVLEVKWNKLLGMVRTCIVSIERPKVWASTISNKLLRFCIYLKKNYDTNKWTRIKLKQKEIQALNKAFSYYHNVVEKHADFLELDLICEL